MHDTCHFRRSSCSLAITPSTDPIRLARWVATRAPAMSELQVLDKRLPEYSPAGDAAQLGTPRVVELAGLLLSNADAAQNAQGNCLRKLALRFSRNWPRPIIHMDTLLSLACAFDRLTDLNVGVIETSA
jgi:hypothetical protein